MSRYNADPAFKAAWDRLVAILVTRRADARLGVLVGMVVVAALAFLLAPAVIVAIKDMRVESLGMLVRLLEARVRSV